MAEFQDEPRPITVDELRPCFQGYEASLEIALARFHLAVEREKVRMLQAEVEAARSEQAEREAVANAIQEALTDPAAESGDTSS